MRSKGWIVIAVAGFFGLWQGVWAPRVMAQDIKDEAISDAVNPLDPMALDRGKALYFSGDYEGALAAWQPLADAGDPRALYNLSTLYRRGLGVAVDPEKASALLQQSAQKGFRDAQYLLATLVFDDSGDDEAKKQVAVRWWLVAARQEHGLSQYRLGLLYWNGEAVARDLVRGHAWMSLAAQTGIKEAQDALLTMNRYLDEDQHAQSRTLMTRLVDEDSAARTTPATAETAAVPTQTDRVASSVASRNGSGQNKPDQDRREKTTALEQPHADGGAVPEQATEDAVFDKSWRLQLLALKNEDEVQKEWARMRNAAPDLLGGLTHKIVPAYLGDRGTFYRLQTGPFASRDAAGSRCRALKAAGLNCFIIAPDG